MKKVITGCFIIMLVAQAAFAQKETTEQQIISLSKNKWQWMADKDVTKLAVLFDDKAKFVHMSGT